MMQSTLEDWLETTTTDFGEEEEEDEVNSCSTFSLQQCIDEFRARRIRRNSAHVSEEKKTREDKQPNAEKVCLDADAELINQNRSNKEHERKNKQCVNGFCYCFTSDSGDGGGGCGAAADVGAANNNRYARRNRKSESAQFNCSAQQSNRAKERRSAPASLKSTAPPLHTNKCEMKQQKKAKAVQITNTRPRLTAVSRLETTSYDAPLIHIIQELRDNCVLSEVRVNKHKLQQKNIARSKPKISENRETLLQPMDETTSERPIECKSTKNVDVMARSIPVTRLEIKNKSPRRPGAGRLLQKRLSHSNSQCMPWSISEPKPPPKPPRLSAGSRLESSNSSLTTSTSPSMREAERIVDEFLHKNGVPIPKLKENSKNLDDHFAKNHGKRQSSPRAQNIPQTSLPTCPSLSDIERIVDTKKRSSYGKNIQQHQEEQVKDIAFGWKESKVSEMLNYDSNGNRKEFKSQSAQAEPQSLGWQIPPKLQLDTVDGGLRHNLAANLETKNTPVKQQFNGNKKDQHQPSRTHGKFGWRNLSPWTSMNTNSGTMRMRKCPKATRSFLKQSKKKILRLVTPKKDNKEHNFHARKTPYRSVGIQTSVQDLGSYENSSTLQSPPGSYHSAEQATNTPPNTQSNNPSDISQFDFTRKVNSPPKKATRTSHRKLSFPAVCGDTSATNQIPKRNDDLVRRDQATRTYRSYHSDLDQDVTISKMGFILSNIRARLEASDERAVRTFEEIERREQLEHGFDCPDSHGIRQRTNIDIHSNVTYPERGYTVQEPIYSEIEEDSIHVTESPQYDNKTASGGVDLDALYAKVVKTPKKNTSSIPLAHFLHDSIKRTDKLPALPEPSIITASCSSPPGHVETSIQNSDYDSPSASLMHCHSLNNVRVMEHHSPPKRNRNLSKSDLSLQRSEIFLENLCRSEFIVEDGTLERLEKIDNLESNRDSDDISYDVPDEFGNDDAVGNLENTAPTSSPQKFLTKSLLNSTDTEAVEATFSNQYEAHCNSCPVTPKKCTKFNEKISQSCSQPNSLNSTIATEIGATSSALSRYKRLALQALQNSIRKSKNFVKSRHSPSKHNNSTQPIEENIKENSPEIGSQTDVGSCLDLERLFAIDEKVSVTEQIARAVTICRQLPELETTPEMVEAERLLLYTSLRQDSKRQQLKYESSISDEERGFQRNFIIERLHFPVNFEANLEHFFNYYFTLTFEIDNQVYSTQSTECRRGEVIFSNCNFDINIYKKQQQQQQQQETEPSIHFNVFMLRLRRITTLTTSDANDLSCDASPLSSTPFSSSSSLNGITSRFRFYGTFTLNAKAFKPFVFCNNNNQGATKTDMICLESATTGNAFLKLCSKNPIPDCQISIDGCVKAFFPKATHSGFLHVQDPFSQHNWNRRWCNLNGLQLEIWTDMCCMTEAPLLLLDLSICKQSLPLTSCPRELCARTRSFCLEYSTRNAADHVVEMATVFFAAENETDFNRWLQHLNKTLNFIATWMQ